MTLECRLKAQDIIFKGGNVVLMGRTVVFKGHAVVLEDQTQVKALRKRCICRVLFSPRHSSFIQRYRSLGIKLLQDIMELDSVPQQPHLVVFHGILLSGGHSQNSLLVCPSSLRRQEEQMFHIQKTSKCSLNCLFRSSSFCLTPGQERGSRICACERCFVFVSRRPRHTSRIHGDARTFTPPQPTVKT